MKRLFIILFIFILGCNKALDIGNGEKTKESITPPKTKKSIPALKLGPSCLKNPVYTEHPKDKDALKKLIDEAIKKDKNADLSYISTSQITDMSQLFENKTSFNGNISCWDVSKVKNMREMFDGATAFNQDLSRWKISKVTNMLSMFYGAAAFNNGGNPLTWGEKTSQVTSMGGMFLNAKAFNQDVSSWNVSKVTEMLAMFWGAAAFNQDISKWDVSKVIDMGGMFYGATSFNQDLSEWDVSKVIDTVSMFENAKAFNNGDTPGNSSKPLKWGKKIKKDEYMEEMFKGATAFNQDISDWDISGVTHMKNMFHSATAFNQDVSKWNVSKVIHMKNMFHSATAFNNGGNPKGLKDWKVGTKTVIEDMFTNTLIAKNKSYPDWCTGNCR